MDVLEEYWAEMEQKTKSGQQKKQPKKMDALDKYWAETSSNQPKVNPIVQTLRNVWDNATRVEPGVDKDIAEFGQKFDAAESMIGRANPDDKPSFPQGEIGPKRPTTVTDVIADPGAVLGKALDKPGQYAKTAVAQGASDIAKGLTLGGVNLKEGTILGRKVMPSDVEFLPGAGVDPEIAGKNLTGFKAGDALPFLKDTPLDIDVQPLEWAGAAKPIGAVSRGIWGKVSKPIAEAIGKAVPVALQPLVPTLARIFNATATGAVARGGSGLLQGQGMESLPENLWGGAKTGVLLGLIGEGMYQIANAPHAPMKRAAFKQSVDKMAKWAYGEGRFNSLEEAQATMSQLLTNEINAHGGVKKMTLKDIAEYNKALEAYTKQVTGSNANLLPGAAGSVNPITPSTATSMTPPSTAVIAPVTSVTPSNAPQGVGQAPTGVDIPPVQNVASGVNMGLQEATTKAVPFQETLIENARSMTPEDVTRSLYYSEKAGNILNEAAYNEAQKNPKSSQLYIDMDGLKEFNDTYGHDAGDRAIRLMGEALKESGLPDVFHLHGDEFAGQGNTDAEIHSAMEKVDKFLQSAKIEVTSPDGTIEHLLIGGFSYGVGTDSKTAEQAMYQHKAARELNGERKPRGTKQDTLYLESPGTVQTNSTGGEDNRNNPPGRSSNPIEPVQPAAKVEPVSVSDNTMTIERVGQEPFTLKRGDRVRVFVGRDSNGHSIFNERTVVGISQTKGTVKVKSDNAVSGNGVEYEKGYIYPPKTTTVTVDKAPSGGWSEEDRVPQPNQAKRNSMVASMLRKQAGQLQKQIDAKRNPAIAQQNLTARRARIAAGMAEEADRLEEQQQILNRLAELHESGQIPESLKNIRTRKQIEDIKYKGRQAVGNASSTGKGSRKDSYEDSKHGDFVKFEGHVHPSHLNNLLEIAKGKRGSAEAAQRVRLLMNQDGRIKNESDMKAIETLVKIAEKSGNGKDSSVQYAKEGITEYRRLLTAGIKNSEDLRKALADLQNLKTEKKEVPNREIKELERQLIGTKIPGYFPTPKAVVDRMIDKADIEPGMKVLEPSAGKGNIADAIKEAGATPDVVEINPTLRNVLEKKGYSDIKNDFLEMLAEPTYDRVVMNPPFENGQDIDHVKHAYDLLKPGGRVVAIMSEGPFFRGDKKAKEFREWLESVEGTSEKLPEGSFKSSERPTGVATRLVVIDKPGRSQFNLQQFAETMENLKKGQEAIEKVIKEKTDVRDAMYRPDLGGISFYWGEPGTPEKGFKNGYGISHLIARRDLEDGTGQAVAQKMAEVIAKGDITRRYGPANGERANIEYDGHTAVMSLYKQGNRETWLLTGWKNNNAPGATGEGDGSSGATHAGPMRTRPNEGAGASNHSMPQSDKKINSPDFSKLETAAKEAGFKDLDEAVLAFQAKKNGVDWYKAQENTKSGKGYAELMAKVNKLPEQTKKDLEFNLQFFAKKDNQVSIEERNYEMVSKRHVRAYQQLHPELADYIQAEAIRIIGELSDTVKGERFITGSQREGAVATGTSKMTSETIQRIQDATGATYAEIGEVLEAIAKGTPGINTALAKKVELIIDDNLSNGVTDLYGQRIEADGGYKFVKDSVKPVSDTELYDAKQLEKVKAKYEARLVKMKEKERARLERQISVLKYQSKEKLQTVKEQDKGKIAAAKEAGEAKVQRVKYQEMFRRILERQENKETKAKAVAKTREFYKKREEHLKEVAREKKEGQKYLAEERKIKNKLIDEIKSVRSKLSKMRPEFQRPVKAILDDLNIKTPTRKTVNRLTRIAQYLEANPENRIPKETVAKLKVLGRKNIRDMSLEEIRTVHDAVLHYVQLNILKNKLIMKGRYREAAEIKNDAIDRIHKLKVKRIETPGHIDTSRPKTDPNPIAKLHKLQLNAEVITQILDGERGGTFAKVFYEGADEGRNLELSVHFGAKDLIDAGLEKSGINPKDLMPWSEYFNTRKSAVEYQKIKLQNGQEFQITKGDRIALYLHSLNDNNRASVLKGGIYPEKNKTLKVRLTESDLNNIISGMTKEEKTVADIFYDLYNNFSKEKLNERSLELDGFERGIVANYYPKKTPELEKNYDPLKPRDNPYARFTTEGQGFLKERTGAHKAIILEDAFKTLYRHLEGLGAYYGRSTYLRNARMLLNDKGFRKELEAVDNGYTWKRLENFVNDFESFGTRREDIDKVVSGWLNKIDTSILGANPKIIIKQFLSYPLMFNQINPKYLLSTMGKRVDWDTIFKYSPQLRQRREGDVSVETGELGRVGAVRRFFTGKEAIGSKLTRGIEEADGVQLGNAWNAVEAETKELHPSLTPDSEEYYKHVAKRTEEVFRHSQSVFDPKDRSELGRSQNLAWRIITRFTSQRNVIYNDLVRTVLDWQQSNKTAGDFSKMAFRMFNSTLVASSLMAVIEALWALAVRRKEWDKVLEDNAPWKLAQQFLGDILGYAYLAGDAYDLVTQIKERGAYGTDLSNPLMDTFKESGIAIGETWKAVEQLRTREIYKSGPNKWKPKWRTSAGRAANSAATAISRLLGLPYYNIKTLIKSGKSYIFGEKPNQGKKPLKF